MDLKAARCPACSGDIHVPIEGETAKCLYCGTEIVIEEEGQRLDPASAMELKARLRTHMDSLRKKLEARSDKNHTEN